jgi:methylmalonyl-CoA mutase N-terminal domain/subunit
VKLTCSAARSATGKRCDRVPKKTGAKPGTLMRAIDEWHAKVLRPSLKDTPERTEPFVTTSGTQVKRLYTPQDALSLDYLQDLGFPGEPPFTRGIYPTMHRGRLWTMRMYSGFGTAEQTNQRYRHLLKQGQTGLSVAFDLPTQIGYDSDHLMAAGEVGKCGVAVSSAEDMASLFQDIPLDKVSTSMTINAPAAVLLAMYITIAKRQGIEPKLLRGTIQNDILKEYVARGTYIFPPGPSMRLITDTFAYCGAEMPNLNTISISGYHIREAGSTAIQEVAFTFANGIAYVQAAINAGLAVDEFAPRLSFFFGSHNDLFEEIAKFRAARRLWYRIMMDRFGARDPRSWLIRFHTQTAGCSLTAQQPENNIVRVAIQALAAVLGGTQSLHTNSMDEALALPTEKAVTIALRTQQILAHESGVANTIDPCGGSYYLETLTDDIEEGVEAYLDRIDKMGGVLRAIETGYIQREIQESAYRYQKEIERGGRVVVGLNRFEVADEKRTIDYLRVDPAVEEVQKQRLARLRHRRDRKIHELALSGLRAAAEGNTNLVPPILDAVAAHATLGEICDLLRNAFGEYKPPQIV